MKITRDKGIIENASAPTSADVYRVGTIWVDTTNDLSYTLTDVTAGVSTWLKTAGIGSGSIDLEGDYLLNDQTTTNMMSKGTVYRFDGAAAGGNIITAPDNASTANIFNGGGFVRAKISPLSDGGGDNGFIVANRDAGGHGWTFRVDTGIGTNVSLYFTRIFSGTNGVWETGLNIPIGEYSDVAMDYDDSNVANVPTFYRNGIPLSLNAGSTVQPTGTATDGSGWDYLIGNNETQVRTFDGEIGEVMLGNFAPTAAEVKDLISGNIPFKWQYGSQTELVTNGSAEAFTGGLADGWYNLTHTYAEESTIVHTAGGKSQKITAVDGTVLYGGLQNTSTGMEIGKSYRWSAWAYSATATRSMTYELRNNGNSVRATQTQDVGAGWTEFTGVYTAVDAISAPDVWIKVTPTASDVYYFDDISIVALGAVALYTQDSISETYWRDKANGNDGAVTGAEVLNPPSVTPLNCLSTMVIRTQPGGTAGTNLNVTSQSSAANAFNSPALTNATNMIADTNLFGSFSLSADGTTITVHNTETVVGLLPYGLTSHKINSASTTESYVINCLIVAGNVTIRIKRTGSTDSLSWLTVMDASDLSEMAIGFVTAKGV